MSRRYLLEATIRHKNGDCYVLNTGGPSGQHWLTDDSYHEKALQPFHGLPISMQVAQLQGVEALTCGEHCITFLCNVVNAATYTTEAVKNLDYAKSLHQVADELNESCDQYVASCCKQLANRNRRCRFFCNSS